MATQTVPAADVAGEAARPFTLPVQPWSFSGRLISLVWGIEVVDAASQRSARVEFVAAPEGREIHLCEIAGAPPTSAG